MSLPHEAFRIAYEQLRGQKDDLRSLRGQAATAAAISGLVATVFSAIVASSNPNSFTISPVFMGLGLEILVVLAALTGSLTFAIITISGWAEVNFELNPETWIHANNYRSKEDKIEEKISEEMAVEATKFFRKNEEVLDKAKANLLFSLILAFAQIPAWMFLLV